MLIKLVERDDGAAIGRWYWQCPPPAATRLVLLEASSENRTLFPFFLFD